MRTLAKPEMDATEVFQLCNSKVRNADLKRRLQSIEADIGKAAEDYERAASSASLERFPRRANIGLVTKEELMKVYSGRMAKKDQPGRSVYDKIFIAAPRRECPLCGSEKVMGLDHHLPKSTYPILGVSPTNLVPSCSWCQQNKRQGYPRNAEEQTLHPYYDDFESETWLNARVDRTIPASFVFFADAPAGWCQTMRERVVNHMRAFKLADLFALNASTELVNMRHRLTRLFAIGDAEEVRRDLTADARDLQRIRLNSWETAMYVAAASSDWFCEGGFAPE